ncbi:putative transmembrane protein [Toxoplasma gondii VAND]|uniref:Putative transmembrane protein n=1 Tax=Toxoplasma gondii VAND TaxID=933077 RepID=A0A086QGC4_TOXGO|nr:putative transmembrane protein [Toxoplasma gondii VAND]
MKVLFFLGLLAGGLLCSADTPSLDSDPSASPLRAVLHLRGPSPVPAQVEPHEADGSYLEATTGNEHGNTLSDESEQEEADIEEERAAVSALQMTQKEAPNTGATGVAGPEQCSCEFAGSCLPKGSCLGIAFTLVAATLFFVIFLAWLLQWIIAIPSEWILAKRLSKRDTSTKNSPREEDDGRQALLQENDSLDGRQDEAKATTEGTAISREEEEERERTIRAGPSGLPPPSPKESGRL